MRKTILFAALGAMLLALVVSTPGIAEDYNPPPGWSHPAPGRSVTAWYGADNSRVGAETSHSGIDFGTASAPDTKIKVTGDGQVQIVQKGGLLFQGTTIVIFHGWDAEGQCVSTLYAHNRNPRVQPGQVVTSGETLATAYGFQPPNGSPFQWHLHYSYLRACPGEYRYGDFVNPEKLPVITTRWDGQPPSDQGNSMEDLMNVEWDVQGRDLLEVEFKPIETEAIQEEIYTQQSGTTTSENINMTISTSLIIAIGFLALIGFFLLLVGKAKILGLAILAGLAIGVFILITSISSSYESGKHSSAPVTEYVEVEFPPLRQQLDSPASYAEEIIFPDLPSIEEVMRQPVGSASARTPGEILPLADLLEIDVSETAKSHIRSHYSEIVDRSLNAGYNPALVISIWIEESGASDYGRYPGVADFGCIRFPREDFNSQLNCFLSLWSKYESTEQFRVCRGEDNKLSLREFLLIYEGGFRSCENNQFLAEPQFPRRIREYYSKVTGGAELDF